MPLAKGAGTVASRQRRFKTGALGSKSRTKPSIPKTSAPAIPKPADKDIGALQFTSPEFQASLTPQAARRMGNVPFTTVPSLPFGWQGVNLPFGLGMLLEQGAPPGVVEHELLHNEPGGQGSAIYESLTPQQQLSFRWTYLGNQTLEAAEATTEAWRNWTPGMRRTFRVGAGLNFLVSEGRLTLPGASEREVFPKLHDVYGTSGIPAPQRGFYTDTFKMSAFAGPNVNTRRYQVVRR